jgi:hypothetical protein
LASHRDVAALCRKGIVGRGIDLFESGIDAGELRYEVGLSELGEWMNFRIYLPDQYSFTDADGQTLDLRLECFNSVDGSSRLVILFGRFRFVCSNGLVIGETKIEIKERHGQRLDLASIPERIREALGPRGQIVLGWRNGKPSGSLSKHRHLGRRSGHKKMGKKGCRASLPYL